MNRLQTMQVVFGVLGSIVFIRYFLIRCVATICDPRMWRLVIGRVRTGKWVFEE